MRRSDYQVEANSLSSTQLSSIHFSSSVLTHVWILARNFPSSRFISPHPHGRLGPSRLGTHSLPPYRCLSRKISINQITNDDERNESFLFVAPTNTRGDVCTFKQNETHSTLSSKCGSKWCKNVKIHFRTLSKTIPLKVTR